MSSLRSPNRLQFTILVLSGAIGIAALLVILLGGSSSKRSAAQVTINRINQYPWPQPARTQTKHAVATAPTAHKPAAPAQPSVSLAKMIGQEVMVRMSGTSPDAALLERIRRGEVGGVILYADNIVSEAQVRSLTAQLQSAARRGGNPPLLISTDQEGGQVKRLPWAPPTIAPPQMGAQGSAVSESQGARTGQALRADGINVDLAPVVDVAHSASVFIWKQGRSFGMSGSSVVNSAVPFALGMRSSGVAPTAKHFPGLGGALVDTDYALQHVVSRPEDLEPYAALIREQIPMVMVSTGVFPSLGSSVPAALSPTIVTGLLRQKMGFSGVIITDDLERPTGYTTAQAATQAAAAGADVVLVSTTEGGGAGAYAALLGAVQSGSLSRTHVRQSYQRVLRLKQQFARG
jgi:beta-N-acetylhexosaminidase